MGVKTVKAAPPQLEVALADDAGTAKGGLFGLTDLFTYASDFAAKRQETREGPPVRITQWLSNNVDRTISRSFDSCPGSLHAPGVVIVANNHRSILEPEHDSPLPDWLRARHADGAVLAAVCGGVFMLARTGLLSGRQATIH